MQKSVKEIAKNIHDALIGDQVNESYHEWSLGASSLASLMITLIQFLEIHSTLRRTVNYDNAELVFTELVLLLRPDLQNPTVMKQILFFLKQDFLYENLQRNRRKFFSKK